MSFCKDLFGVLWLKETRSPVVCLGHKTTDVDTRSGAPGRLLCCRVPLVCLQVVFFCYEVIHWTRTLRLCCSNTVSRSLGSGEDGVSEGARTDGGCRKKGGKEDRWMFSQCSRSGDCQSFCDPGVPSVSKTVPYPTPGKPSVFLCPANLSGETLESLNLVTEGCKNE